MALGFALIRNHPFVGGNRRLGHAALEVFLVLNGYELQDSIESAEQIVLGVAAGAIDRMEFVALVRTQLRALPVSA